MNGPAVNIDGLWIRLLCAVMILTPALAQTQRQAEFHETYNLEPGGTVSVSNVSGYIRVTGWNENRVRVDAVKRAHSSSADLDQVEIQVTARPDRVEVRTVYHRRSVKVSVDYDVRVPRSAVLNSLTSTSGDITVIGPVGRTVARSTSGSISVREIKGEANLSTTSGHISAERIEGMLTVHTTSGELQISEVGGQLNARSTSGSIQAASIRDDAIASSISGSLKLEGVGGRVEARSTSSQVHVIDAAGDVMAGSTSNTVRVEEVRGRATVNTTSGNIIVRNAEGGVIANTISGTVEISHTKGRIEATSISGQIRLQNLESREVKAKSLSGGISFQGRLYEDGRYDFDGFSGAVVLWLPANSNFNLSAQSYSGEIETEFPIQLDRVAIAGRPQRIQGVHGSGGAQISVKAFSGSIRLRRQ